MVDWGEPAWLTGKRPRLIGKCPCLIGGTLNRMQHECKFEEHGQQQVAQVVRERRDEQGGLGGVHQRHRHRVERDERQQQRGEPEVRERPEQPVSAGPGMGNGEDGWAWDLLHAAGRR